MTGSFARGAPTFNSMFFKHRRMMRKDFHKETNTQDMMRETSLKSNAEEGTVGMKRQQENYAAGENEWLPHESTGIYCPKGHEHVMDDVPAAAARDFGAINWFSETH